MPHAIDVSTRLCETVRLLKSLTQRLPDPICLSFLPKEGEPEPEEASKGVRATERALNAVFAQIGVRNVQYVHAFLGELTTEERFISDQLCQALDYHYGHFDDPESAKALARVVRQFDFSGEAPTVDAAAQTL